MLRLCFFLFPNGLWFMMQTGQQVAITVACSCEMMLVPVRSILYFFFFFVMFVLMFNNYVHGDYPYMPHSKWANISETGLQSVSGTGDLTFTMPNLCILVHCKECQHTERSRSIQWVLEVPSPQEYPGDLEGHEAQRSQKDQWVPFLSRLVALVAQ